MLSKPAMRYPLILIFTTVLDDIHTAEYVKC